MDNKSAHFFLLGSSCFFFATLFFVTNHYAKPSLPKTPKQKWSSLRIENEAPKSTPPLYIDPWDSAKDKRPGIRRVLIHQHQLRFRQRTAAQPDKEPRA